MAIITNIEDLRRIARRKIPRAIYDYVERGSYDELTLNANRDELNAIRLRQRVLIDVSTVSLASTMLGEAVSMPLAIAPTGLTGLVHGDGEMLAARAAEAAGIKFCLSTMSICSIEDVQSVVSKPFWFQLYMFRDRGFSQSVIERARAAKCSALFVTVDLPHARPAPRRHQERFDGSSAPDCAQRLRHRHEAGLAPQGAARSAQDVRECRSLSEGPRRDREGRRLVEPEFRPVAELARRRMGPQPLAGQASA
jgi:L-lactate dehydrogenase (cytochrome)